MSTSTKTILALCTVVYLAACGAKEPETVYIEDSAAVSTEPTYTGKYK